MSESVRRSEALEIELMPGDSPEFMLAVLGARLEAAMEEKGISQRQLAASIGLQFSGQLVRAWLDGSNWMQPSTFAKICRAVGKPPSYFWH